MKKLLDILPLVIFVTLIIVLFSFLSNEDDQLETALIDESFPESVSYTHLRAHET